MELNNKNLPEEISSMMNFDIDPEPYILTPEEEKSAIENEKISIARYITWKMKGLVFSDAQIFEKISSLDWSKEIDEKEILKRANSNKHYGVWQQQQRELEKKEIILKQEKLKEQYTAKNLYRFMQWTSETEFGKRLILHDNNKHLIKSLCYFISRDEKFETELGYSLKKGIVIRGVSGLGKTHLVQCISKNELNPILILSILDITGDIKSDGEYEVKLGNNKIIYLDDVGTEEPTVNHFGTKISFFKNFIESYYLRNKNFNCLMFSTNNSFSEIEEKYGFRVRSRMKDMFNIIDITGEDMRGK